MHNNIIITLDKSFAKVNGKKYALWRQTALGKQALYIMATVPFKGG